MGGVLDKIKNKALSAINWHRYDPEISVITLSVAFIISSVLASLFILSMNLTLRHSSRHLL